MINLLPAVLIGGPSHAGKSVLFYNLTRALRKRQIPHHALRVYPTSSDTCTCSQGKGKEMFASSTLMIPGMMNLLDIFVKTFLNASCLYSLI